MPDIWMDVDTALSGVPVNIMPLLDDTDFKTRETAIAYNAAGMDLVWNFVTSAGAFTQTAVTPTTAGVYDWTHQGDGMYTIEIPASGGASINNDTEGYGWFSGLVTGVLPWRGPVIGFRAAAINDSLCDANITGLLAPTVAGRTLDVSAGGEAGLDWGNVGTPGSTVSLTGTTVATVTTTTTATNLTTNNDKTGYSLTNLTVTAGTTLGAGTHTAQTGDSYARLGAPVSASISADLATVDANVDAVLADTGTDGVVVAAGSKTGYQLSATGVDDIWDELRAGHVTAGTFGEGVPTRPELVSQASGVCTTGGTTTSIPTSSLTPAAGVADQFKGRIVIFDNDTTTANLRGQATDITASTAGGVLTVAALTTAPASGDTFKIV